MTDRTAALAMVLLITSGCQPPAAPSPHPSVAASPHKVLRVGLFHGIAGDFTTIQAAVAAAQPGDWILVAPGDYHETGAPDAGVLIVTPGIHLRGMDRNTVVVDGTLPGFGRCSADAAAQNPGPTGRHGILVQKVDGVSIENITVCNFLGTFGGGGNQIWFDGGDGSGQTGLSAFTGRYLTTSSSFFSPSTFAIYGLFAVNSRGPGRFEFTYSSNMADAGYYIGACPDCNTTIRFGHAQNNAFGYSGTNAGGHLVIESSEWDLNRSGIVPNSLNSEDAPSPQNGACPDQPGESCTLIQNNSVHDNNNPNTPTVGLAVATAIGAGIILSGSANDTVRDNVVYHQGAWGILVIDFPDTGNPPPIANCAGGLPNFSSRFGRACYFVAHGNRVIANRLYDNGFFGNRTNSDLADATLDPASHGLSGSANCFSGNVDPLRGSPTSVPADIQSPSVLGTCGAVRGGGDVGELVDQASCAGIRICPAGDSYPQPTRVTMLPIPDDLAVMPNPCEGVPSNPWCKR